MNNRIETVTGVVLAGGKSSRMGTDKAFVRVNKQPLIEHSLAALRQCFTRNIIIANHCEAYRSFALPVFADLIPNLGPIGGLQAALHHAETPAVFLVACDMPFLDPALIRAMALDDFDAVAPCVRGRYEPLHAGYARRILPVVEQQIAAGRYGLQELLIRLRVRSLGEERLQRYAGWPRSFSNVNTPADLAID